MFEWSKNLNGWLSPSGEFFECAPLHHVVIIEHIIRKPSYEAEKTGWLKIVDGHVLNVDRPPNEYQLIALNNAGFLCDVEADYFGSPFHHDGRLIV
ncbi:MAG: hypothetical protein WC503_01225 [Candidatus Shapirobacteria bacterium]